MSTPLSANQIALDQPALPSGRVVASPPPMKTARSGPLADRVFGWLAKGAALFTLALLLAILVSLTVSAWPAIDKFGLGFLTSTRWDPVKQEFGGQGEFSVTDSGPGIAPEHIPRLTERFYRVDRSRSRETGGTGLGLAIVKHVVQRHGAQLRIASVPGQGATFSIVFPAARIQATALTADALVTESHA